MELWRPAAQPTFISFPLADATGFALSGKGALTGTWCAWGDTAGPNAAGNPGFRSLSNAFTEISNTAVYAGQLAATELPAASPYVMCRFVAAGAATQYLLIRTSSVYANVTGIQGTNIATPVVAGTMPTDVMDTLLSAHTVAGSFGERLGTIRRNTMQSGSTTYCTLDAGASAVNDFYTNRMLYCTGGTGAGQVAGISSYTGSSKGASFYAAVATAFDSTSIFEILPSAAFGPAIPTAAEIVNLTWATPSRTITGGGSTVGAGGIDDSTFTNGAKALLANLAWATAARTTTGGTIDTVTLVTGVAALNANSIDDGSFKPGARQLLANLAWATATKQVTSLSSTSASDVTSAVNAAFASTYAEPGQGAPAATASLAAKIGYLYKAWRNKLTQTNTSYRVYGDDETTVDQKATFSDDGTTATKGEVGSGP